MIYSNCKMKIGITNFYHYVPVLLLLLVLDIRFRPTLSIIFNITSVFIAI